MRSVRGRKEREAGAEWWESSRQDTARAKAQKQGDAQHVGELREEQQWL